MGAMGSEDYVVVWAGVYRRLGSSEEEVPLELPTNVLAKAKEVNLEVWHDTFEVDPVCGPVSCALIGRRLEILGYKEGTTRFSLSAGAVAKKLEDIRARLIRIGIRQEPRVHVLLHLEDGE